jgi:hypothetical protein
MPDFQRNQAFLFLSNSAKKAYFRGIA